MEIKTLKSEYTSKNKKTLGVPVVAQWKRAPLAFIRKWVQSLASFCGLRIQHCCKLCVGRRLGSDLVLLWLWRRPAATAPIQPLAWKFLSAMGVALKR